jgi:ornithine cyclodeaminase
MLILNSKEVEQALPMDQCIEAMKMAFSAFSSGQVEMPLRTRLPNEAQDGVSLLMPALLQNSKESALAVKIVSVFNNNPAKGLPLIHAAVLVLDSATGEIEAMMEGASLTAIRTGAGSGAATDLLARKEANSVAILGAGTQARSQLRAVCEVRSIKKIWVFAPSSDHINQFIEEMSGAGPIPNNIVAARNAKEAIRAADIVCTATTSNTPVIDDRDIQTGTHINAVGAFTLDMQEIPSATVARSKIAVDSRSASLAESGEIANALQEKLITAKDISEIGEIILDPSIGRQSRDEITFFKSVGLAVQDAAAGQLALKNAIEMNLGTQVDW